MKRTSITDAKNGLSALIDRVRHGESVIIEDRGVPVARLESVSVPGRDVEGRAARLQRRGVMRPAPAAALTATARKLLNTVGPAPKGGVTLSDAVIAERRDGR